MVVEANKPGIWGQILASVSVAATATYAKLTLQRRWRDWLNAHVLDQWLASGRYYQLKLVPGDHSNPEYRMAEDLRLSVEAPVEFAMGVFSAVISAITFIGVLWFIVVLIGFVEGLRSLTLWSRSFLGAVFLTAFVVWRVVPRWLRS